MGNLIYEIMRRLVLWQAIAYTGISIGVSNTKTNIKYKKGVRDEEVCTIGS